jgi:2-desacetyl-2-hydroxyethyl bacteriochlorophyllide A dehydrogenase
MKAIVYEGPNKVEVKNIPMPEVPAGWVLIKVSHAGICGTDLNIYAGTHPRAKAPLVMGHEFSGVVEKDATNLPKGTRVTVYPLLSCGECTPCKTGNAHVCNTLKLIGIDRDGGMAQFVVAPLETVIPLSDKVSDKLGAFVEPIAVAVHAIRENNFVPGDNAIVFGCGTIGLATALTLRKFGATEVVMIETDEARSNIARTMGFEVLNPITQDVNKIAHDKTGGDGFDWIYDCAGVQPVADLLFDLVRVKGHIVIIAAYKKPAALPLIKGMFKETSIQFTRVYRLQEFAVAAKLAAEEPLFEKIITHVLPADEAQKGFDLLTTKGTGAVKVMFSF